MEYSTNNVAAWSGASLRQLQWWDEQGLVVAGRRGRRRIWDRTASASVVAIAKLLRKGMGHSDIRRISGSLGKGLAKEMKDGREALVCVCVDSRKVVVIDPTEWREVYRFATSAPGSVIVVFVRVP